MKNTPPMYTKGRFVVTAPWSFSPAVIYECIAIRSFEDVYKQLIDVYEAFYKPMGLIDGVNGFLVPKWNPQALAEKMIYFIEHPEQVHMMGDQSHKIAIEKFDAKKVNQRLLEILGI